MIKLTKGRFTMIDDADFDMVSKSEWCYGGHGYAVRGHKGKMLLLHRFLMGLAPGDGIHVDHINGDPLDNRRANLRICTKAENMRNRRRNANSTSGFKGVLLMKDTPRKKPWRAQIKTNGRHHRLGYYKTKEEAALAYDAAAKELHGEFARLNFQA